MKKNRYQLTIDKVEKIRSKNNINWMQILKIAFKHSPQETANVMSNIYNSDNKISKLVKKLTN